MTATAQPSARATAAAAAPARRPTAAPAPAHAPKRPPLRVINPDDKVKRAGRRRPHPRLLVATAVLIGGALLFALVAAHVVLTQNQFRLERMQRQAAEQQARYERLRAQVAELESPGRIVAAAQQRLGMVPPSSVKYLTPATAKTNTGQTAPKATAANGPKSATAPDSKTSAEGKRHNDDDEQAMTEWSAVKRQLSRP